MEDEPIGRADAIARLVWHLACYGTLTERMAGRVYANKMLGDWNELEPSRKRYYIERALVILDRISGNGGIPIYVISTARGQVWEACHGNVKK